MACVDGLYQSSLLHTMPFPRDSLSPQEAQYIDYPSPRPSPRTPSTKHHRSHVRASIVQKCSQLANRRRPTTATTAPTTCSSAPQTLVHWTQRLPSSASEFEDFLEWALDEAVGELVHGPDVAAEEVESWFDYGHLAISAAPRQWVRVQAQLVGGESSSGGGGQGKRWITASVQDCVAPGRRAAVVYATGKWALVDRCSTRRRHRQIERIVHG